MTPPVDWPRYRHRVRGIYLHVPFCVADCAYCAFSREVPVDGAAVGVYLDALTRESEHWAARFGSPLTPITVYAGGGTPTYLSPEEIARVGSILDPLVSMGSVREFTVEANPESATDERLAAWRELGMTRLSIGAQSSHEDVLRFLGRWHDWAAVTSAVGRARCIPGLVVSIDLIYGIPGLALEAWRETVREALALAPDHLSAYCLGYEEGTSLSRRRGRGEISGQTDSEQRDAYDLLVAMTGAAGLDRYEVSNFGSSRGRSRHNLGYWRRRSYLGLGPSAHSAVAEHRFWNHPRRDRWQESLGTGRGPVAGHEAIGPAERLAETLMRLRLVEGVPLSLVPGHAAFLDRVDVLEREGLVSRGRTRLRLTPDAFFLSDAVIADLLEAAERGRGTWPGGDGG